MNLQTLESIAALLQRHNLSFIEYEHAGVAVRLEGAARSGHPVAQSVVPVSTPGTQRPARHVTAPGFGTLHLTHPQRSQPAVQTGGQVRAGDVVAWLECGPLLQEVTAQHGGTVVAIMAEQGALVGYAQPLFELE